MNISWVRYQYLQRFDAVITDNIKRALTGINELKLPVYKSQKHYPEEISKFGTMRWGKGQICGSKAFLSTRVPQCCSNLELFHVSNGKFETVHLISNSLQASSYIVNFSLLTFFKVKKKKKKRAVSKHFLTVKNFAVAFKTSCIINIKRSHFIARHFYFL